jgi:nucleotide-binding universal stress UspA family protein
VVSVIEVTIMITLQNILVPSDFSECSDAAVRYGLELARKFDATLHLLHVVQDPMTMPWAAEGFGIPMLEVVEQWQKEAEARLNAAIPPADRGRVRVSSAVASPYPEILRFAAQNGVDLIVMGTHGRGGVTHLLLGSIAEKVVRRAPCPVLTVRYPQHGFVDLPVPVAAEADLAVCATASAT